MTCRKSQYQEREMSLGAVDTAGTYVRRMVEREEKGLLVPCHDDLFDLSQTWVAA